MSVILITSLVVTGTLAFALGVFVSTVIELHTKNTRVATLVGYAVMISVTLAGVAVSTALYIER